jgi:hypothetical protein
LTGLLAMSPSHAPKCRWHDSPTTTNYSGTGARLLGVRDLAEVSVRASDPPDSVWVRIVNLMSDRPLSLQGHSGSSGSIGPGAWHDVELDGAFGSTVRSEWSLSNPGVPGAEPVLGCRCPSMTAERPGRSSGDRRRMAGRAVRGVWTSMCHGQSESITAANVELVRWHPIPIREQASSPYLRPPRPISDRSTLPYVCRPRLG